MGKEEVGEPPVARGKLFEKSFPLDPLQKLLAGERGRSMMTGGKMMPGWVE